VKIAVTGKGGTGKTTVSAALCRHLARHGEPVVAIDADPNPNLGIALGMAPEAVEALQPILNALLASGHTHADPTPDPEDLLSRFGVPAPDGVVLVATGKIERPTDSCLCCGSHTTTRSFFGDLRADGRTAVADLEAGLNDLLWAAPGPDDVVLVVTEPGAASMEVARRAGTIATELGIRRLVGVSNRSTGEADVARLAEVLPGREIVAVPEDPAVERAAHLGQAPFDRDAGSPAMAAIARLADRLAGGG
jgi:CO dehydrogenase maturation factor